MATEPRVGRSLLATPDGWNGCEWPMVDLKALLPEDRYSEEIRQKDAQFRGLAVLDLGCPAETDVPPSRLRQRWGSDGWREERNRFDLSIRATNRALGL